MLCLSPEYQRMGVGRKLLEWGMQEADREGVECWIDCSLIGSRLYKEFEPSATPLPEFESPIPRVQTVTVQKLQENQGWIKLLVAMRMMLLSQRCRE
jgi:GNAT superfamily N-acetyltransferase